MNVRTPPLAAALALVTAGALAFAGCSNGTTLFIVADISQVPGTQQLHISGRDGETLVFGPTIRPETAGDPLDGPQSVRVKLPDDADGKTITVRVEALVNGQSRGAAQADVEAKKDAETRVELALEQTPIACANCAGCCANGQCVTQSVAACGAGGVACFACDPIASDNCSSNGRCGCGTGPACTATSGADRCVDGTCRCGNGPACPAGTECDNGLCRCTPASCAGCCNANSCQPGTVDNACGTGGGACEVCSGTKRCVIGACQ